MSERELFITLALAEPDMMALVSDMKAQGYAVEQTDIGFVCHEKVRHGLALVMSALRGNQRFRVKINPAFFDVGTAQSSELH